MPANVLGRLRKGREFDRVYSEGTVINGPLFVVRAAPNELGVCRWGFAVGKKLAPSAVVRNRTRRRLREAARLSPMPAGFDIVLTARGKLLDAEFSRIREEVRRTMDLLGAKKT